MLHCITEGELIMDFVTAVKTCFSKFATFEGRAARSEYWFFALFLALASAVLTVVDIALGIEVLSLIFSLITLIPSIAVSVRRLHDTNRSGWWYLLIFIPLIGLIVLLIWFCTRGTAGPNRFGEDPLGAADARALPAA